MNYEAQKAPKLSIQKEKRRMFLEISRLPYKVLRHTHPVDNFV